MTSPAEFCHMTQIILCMLLTNWANSYVRRSYSGKTGRRALFDPPILNRVKEALNFSL